MIWGFICVSNSLTDQKLGDWLSIAFLVNDIEETVSCWKALDGIYYVFFPGYVDIGRLQIHLNTKGKIYINGIEIYDGMYCTAFETNIPYEIICSERGTVIKDRIVFKQSKNVASVHIDLEHGMVEQINSSKGNKATGKIRIYTGNGEVCYEGNVEHIVGRGNTTWLSTQKKSYNVKLEEPVDVLSMGFAQKWVLLANALDDTSMKNKIVYDFADIAGLPFSPDSQWIDLYMNGEYTGLYLLCDKLEVHPERISISTEGSSLVSMEYGSRLISQNIPFVSTNAHQALRIRYPEKPTREDIEDLAEKWQSVENAIMSKEGLDAVSGRKWTELIDVDSWARKYLIEEVFGNVDAGFISQFFYIIGDEGEEKAYAGPVWDFDYSMKSLWQTSAPNAWCANRLLVEDGYEAPWFYMLCQKDEFMERVTMIYETEFLPILNDMINVELRNYADYICIATELDSIRWNKVNDVELSVAEIEKYLSERISFLSDVWVENEEYVRVKVFPEYGAHYAYFGIKKGDTLASLPDMSQVEQFDGWYYSDRNTPIDEEKPVFKDIELYSKWSGMSVRAESRIIKLVPITVIALFGTCILITDLLKIKKGGW